MIATRKYLRDQHHVSQMPLQRDTNTNTFNKAEEGEVFQPSANKLLQTSRDKPLEHANRKYRNLTIHNYLQMRMYNAINSGFKNSKIGTNNHMLQAHVPVTNDSPFVTNKTQSRHFSQVGSTPNMHSIGSLGYDEVSIRIGKGGIAFDKQKPILWSYHRGRLYNADH